MNKAEKNKFIFSPCHIEDVTSPVDYVRGHTAMHENRLAFGGAEKTSDTEAMQKYNNNI